MANLFAGIDSSTQSTKLVVIDLDEKRVVFVDSVNYDRDLPKYNTKNGVIQTDQLGVSESDPNMWIEALEILFERLAASPVPQAEIKAISVSGQQHGLVTLDAGGNLTRKTSKLWNDFSTQEECDLLTRAVGGVDKMIEEVGNSQRTGYTAAKIYHMVRHEPETFERTTTCFLVHNFINWYLTGGKEGGVRVMEPGDTSGMALWNPKTGKWSEKVINAISPKLKEKLPPLKPADQSIGKIGKNLAKRFGFSPDCKIDAGCGDNMYGAVGTGNVRPGIVTVSLGTSGTAYTYLEEPYVDPSGEIAAFCDSTGHYLPLLCVSNLANGYNEVLSLFGLSHKEFVEVVKQVPVGNRGRLLLPWYIGERTPDVPNAAPIYIGFALGDFTREALCRAVLEGHILNLYDGFRKMPVKASEIRLTGGLSQSAAWRQTIADIFEAEVVPVEGEGAALGAALHAAWVWKKEAGEKVSLQEVVEPFVVLLQDQRCKPDPKAVAVYRRMKQVFGDFSLRVRGFQTQSDPFAQRMQLTA
ncbi:MAG: xylulokinase [candidate division KSB1 bacterium]|nr:xylulokinase [candidate division KSB1 bacterium]